MDAAQCIESLIERKTKVLFVDDLPGRFDAYKSNYPDHETTWVRTADAANRALAANKYDMVCLDYDLIGKKKGYEVAKFIADGKAMTDPDHIWIHSHNSTGQRRMKDVLKASDIDATIKVKPLYAADKKKESAADLIARLTDA